MIRQSLRLFQGKGRALFLLVLGFALLAPAVARAQERGPRAAFLRAAQTHWNLLCGGGRAAILSLRYVVEPHPGQSLREARDRVIEVLRHRMDDWNVPNLVIIPRGEAQVEVRLPGHPVTAASLRDVLERPGVLGFHPVDTRSPWLDGLPAVVTRWHGSRPDATAVYEPDYGDPTVRADTREELESFAESLSLPPDRILGFQEETILDGGLTNRSRWRLFLLYAEPPVHGGHIASVDVTTDSYDSSPRLSLVFDAAGATAFADVTEAHVRDMLAIVLDGRVMSAPKIMERIEGGRAQITLGSQGGYAGQLAEARALASVLRAGAHPATIRRVAAEVIGSNVPEGWRALVPLPLTAQALGLLFALYHGCP